MLRGQDVSDVRADFVADPFTVRRDGLWYMFFEVLNTTVNRGEIGLATSRDGLAWQYESIVLRQSHHLSYPYVFTWLGSTYMVPEAHEAGIVPLYIADPFPTNWKFVRTLLDIPAVDSSVFRYANKWWMFTCTSPRSHDCLRLYGADELDAQWREHPLSPIVASDNRTARPAGRVLVDGGRIVRYAQDCFGGYGMDIVAFEMTTLTESKFEEHRHPTAPLAGPAIDTWMAARRHHVDASQCADGSWIAFVDGDSRLGLKRRSDKY